MTPVLAEAERNISIVVWVKNRFKQNRKFFEGCENVIAFDEYKLGLDGMEKDITELRGSL